MDVAPNQAPEKFTVKEPKLGINGLTIELNWTAARDPDGDSVRYTVILKDTLVKNLTNTTFTIHGLDYNYSGEGKILAIDAKGHVTQATFSVQTKTATLIEIPDAIYEEALVDNGIDKDGKVNGSMDIDNVKGIKRLSIGNYAIKSLKGIEFFVDLEELHCHNNLLTELDVSKNTKLRILFCYKNDISQLDLSKSTEISTLDFSFNKMKKITLGKKEKLNYLNGSFNLIEELDVKECPALARLNFENNLLHDIDVSKNINLVQILAPNNKLTTLDFSHNPQLYAADFSGNFLSDVNLSNNQELFSFNCSYNSIPVLDLRNNKKLSVFYCYENILTFICVNDIETAKNNPNWSTEPFKDRYMKCVTTL